MEHSTAVMQITIFLLPNAGTRLIVKFVDSRFLTPSVESVGDLIIPLIGGDIGDSPRKKKGEVENFYSSKPTASN